MWEKVVKARQRNTGQARRSSACVVRSKKRPTVAYMMMPQEWAKSDRVSVYHDGKNQIALEFDPAGDYAVRQTSKTSQTIKITIPKSLAPLVPIGLTNVDLKRDGEFVRFAL